jgi:uncharacterized SAM-binding protein YcdF (DUF218 family)
MRPSSSQPTARRSQPSQGGRERLVDTLFFIASKILGVLVRAETWIILAAALGVIGAALNRRRLAVAAGATTLLALLSLTVLPLGDLLLEPIERRYPADPPVSEPAGIIILGGAEDVDASIHWGQAQLNEAADRFTAAVALARRFPRARVLFTGGSGALRDLAGSPHSEAALAERFFLDQGLDPARLLLEGASRNTAENARLSLQIANPQPGGEWLLITSSAHMTRALRSFEAAGWPALTPYPVDFRSASFSNGIGWDLPRNLRILNIALKEHAGGLVYALTGR